jgi:hypothetical protein
VGAIATIFKTGGIDLMPCVWSRFVRSKQFAVPSFLIGSPCSMPRKFVTSALVAVPIEAFFGIATQLGGGLYDLCGLACERKECTMHKDEGREDVIYVLKKL